MTEIQTSDTSLLSALPVAVYMTDPDGRLTWFNDAAEELWGRRPELGATRWCGSWKLFWPDGRPLAHEDCPMAESLRQGRPVRGSEAVVERPDGSRVAVLPYPRLLLGPDGEVQGGVNMLVEIAERQGTGIEAARLAAIVSSSDDAIVSKTLDGIITSWNAAATRILGYTADEMIGRHITTIIPLELRQEEVEIIAKLRRGERVEHFDTRRLRKDGSLVDLSITVSPVRDREGRIVGASKVARDISERKRAEELQRRLFDELNHRVKNTLATVQALATQTMRGERTLDEARQVFQGRLMALSATHDQLSLNAWKEASLATVVAQTLKPFRKRIEIAGPEIMLRPREAVTWGMILHELATNAAKYGALSRPEGGIDIAWSMLPERRIELLWRESGGPQCAAPQRKGFGTRFVERAAANDLAGSCVFDYRPEGLQVTIQATLAAA
ncbi:MAG: sensor histidine kinase [Reyranellaceae bacterium]